VITGILGAWSLVTAATAALASPTGHRDPALPHRLAAYRSTPGLLPSSLVLPMSAITGALVASFLLSHDGLIAGLVGWRPVS
jgi:hypothetical protein